jgi:hypothetical protein
MIWVISKLERQNSELAFLFGRFVPEFNRAIQEFDRCHRERNIAIQMFERGSTERKISSIDVDRLNTDVSRLNADARKLIRISKRLRAGPLFSTPSFTASRRNVFRFDTFCAFGNLLFTL